MGIQDSESSIYLDLASKIEQPQSNAIAAILKGTVNWQAAKAYVIALENKFWDGIIYRCYDYSRTFRAETYRCR